MGPKMQMIKLVLLVQLAFEIEIVLSQCYTNYTLMQDLIDGLDNITFPVDNFNPKCMSLVCLELLNLTCPYKTDGSIDSAIYSQLLSTVQSCLSQQKTICSTPIDPIPVCPLSLDLQNFLSPSDIQGAIALVANTGSVTGLSHTILTYDSTTPTYIYVNVPNLVYQGQLRGSAGIKGSDQNYSLQATPASGTLNVSLILMVQTKPRVSVQVTSTSITANVQFGQLFTVNPGDNVMSIIQILLNYATQQAMQNSKIPKELGTFIGTIIANAIDTAAQNYDKIRYTDPFGFRGRNSPKPVYTNYTSVQDVIDNLDRITLPVDNFKPKCMGLACPALLNLPCPYKSNGSIDNNVYSQILSTVQSCLSQQVPICSTPIDPIPMCPMSMTLQSYLSPLGIDGSLALVPNTTFAIGLSTTVLTYDPNSSYIYVNIPHLVYESQVLGSVGLEGSGQSYSFQSASASVTVNVSLVLMVQTRPRVSVQVTSKSIVASAQYGQLLTTDPGNNVLTIIQTVLSYAAQAAVQSSNIPKDLGTFIGTIIANAVETVAQKCTPN